MFSRSLLTCLFLLFQSACANTEKVIFRAPKNLRAIDVGLPIIAPPQDSRVGKLKYTMELPAVGSLDQDTWTEQWFSIGNTGNDWKYELRVCWPAIMPTEFELDVFRGNDTIVQQTVVLRSLKLQADESQMFLRTRLRPDFITHHDHLRNDSSLVSFELVLDPLLLGLVPRSILGSVGLIIFATVLGWKLVAPRVVSLIEDIVRGKRQKIVRIKTH